MLPNAHFPVIRLSGAYLRRLEPVRVALLGVFIYLLVALLAPLRSTVTNPSMMAIVYLALSYAGFVVGAILYHTLFPHERDRPLLLSAPLPKRLFWVALGLSGLGVGMRMVDRFVLRGVQLGEDFSSVRSQLESAGASPLSTASAVIYPISFGMIFFYYCLPKSARRWWLGVLATVIFLFPSFDAVIAGNRSLMAVSIGFILITRSILVDDLHWLRNKLVIGIALFLVLNLFFIMFEIRVESMGMDFYTSSQNSGYAFTVPPNDFALSYLVDNKGISTSIMSLIIHFTQYYVHSGYEYLYIFDRLPSEHTWGAYNFFHIYKFFALILGDQNINSFISNLDIRVGVYATFFVPLFIDFGWAGPVFMIVFGFILSFLWRATFRHPVAWFPLTAYMSIMLFLMPVASYIFSAQGLYLITSLFIMGVLIHRLDRTGRRITAQLRKA